MSWHNTTFPLPPEEPALFPNSNEIHLPHGLGVTQITEQNVNFGPTLNGDNETVNNPEVENSSSRNSKKRKLKSKVWDDFSKTKEDDGTEWAVCNHCKKKFVGSSKSGTTHLKNHLERCPSKRNPGGGAADKTGDSLTAVSAVMKEKIMKVDEELNHLDETRTFIKYWVPSLVQSRKNGILQVFKEEKEKLRRYFDKLPCRFNLYLDDDDFFYVSVHFIDDNWELKEKVIYFEIEDEDDNRILYEKVTCMLEDWNIDEHICSVDGCHSMFGQGMKQWVSERGSLPLAGTFDPFSGLLVDLCSYSFLWPRFDEVRNRIGNLEKYVGKMSSNGSKNKFEKAVAKSMVNVKLTSEPLPPSLRDFELFGWGVGLKEAFWELQQNDYDIKRLNLTKDEWDFATAVYELWKEVRDVADSISDSKYTTLNVYFPKLCYLYRKLLLWEKSDVDYVREMASAVLEFRFDDYWDNYNLMLAITAVLDPRFKMDIVERWYKDIYGDNANAQIKKVIDEVTNIYNEYAKITNNSKRSTTSHNSEGNSSPHYKILDPKGMPCTSSHPGDNIVSVPSELDRYLKDSTFPTLEEFDILAWWRVNSQVYPTIGRMAQDFLAIPLYTRQPSHSFFEEIENVVTSEELDFDTKEALVYTKFWLYNGEYE